MNQGHQPLTLSLSKGCPSFWRRDLEKSSPSTGSGRAEIWT